jgi:hypothetical protein
MNFSVIFENARKTIKTNSPEILTALGVSGVITTAYLTGKAAFEAAEVLRGSDIPTDRKERIKEEIKQTWILYIPAGISGVITIGCIVGASKTNSRRTAAAVTAYSLTERAFSEYKEKVVEEFGKGKEQKIRDQIAQDRVTNDGSKKDIVVVGAGDVLCCELYTRRYFKSDMEALRKAQNDINSKIIHELYVTLDELYNLLGLTSTSVSGNLGWDSDKMLELQFSTVLTENGEPCLAFEYNYLKPL